MATVAPLLTDIEPLTGITNVTVPDRVSDVIQYVFALEPGDVVNFVPSPSGTPSDIDLTLMTFGLDSALSAGNPITLNFQGINVTATVSAATLPLIEVPDAGVGSGLPGAQGSGEIIVQALNANFGPEDVFNADNTLIEYWVADSNSDFDETGNLIWYGKTGNKNLISNDNSAFFDAVEKAVVFSSDLQFFETDNTTAYEISSTFYCLFVYKDYTNSDSEGAFIGSARHSNNTAFYLDSNTYTSATSIGAQDPVFNGRYDVANSELLKANVYSSTSNVVPINTSFILSTEIVPGFRNTGEFKNSPLSTSDIVAYAIYNSRPSEADEQALIRWAAFLLKDRGVTYDLDANLPDYNVRPLATAGGSASGVTVIAPVESYDRTISGAPTGSAIAIFKRNGSLLADRSQFTLAAGNNSGDGDLVINETIPNDTPASGFVRVARDDGSEDRLAYTSWSGSTFTLSGTLPVTYSSGNGAYVGYLDVLGSATGTETNTLEYVSDRDCVLVVALGSGGGRIRPIRQNITLGASDFEFQVSAIADAINQST